MADNFGEKMTDAQQFAESAQAQADVNAGHVFEGTPDARQSNDTAMRPSRFRPQYRALAPYEKALHDQIKEAAVLIETMYVRIPRKPEHPDLPSPERYRALALTALEESVMWAIKALTA